ncbi:MAG TPA: mechanosensitive ion channel protein [Algoriphagus sp.]|jgi:small conductance mechanosensitive channel|uniref:mechanosensitive ion channel family protein n=1 Tax=unclassified Algoriphagus TaxID=2641541 RepID=UPI000C69F87A|nr:MULTISPECIES: mechanosensitive ion channel domain-containing protein [unclassified Algoriphagus]MAL14778.1 mechanosensitive ion channel protein [Algoriphagus sp.]MAN85527.1 mechanosensitive ion channel protein [Algoriphagus sp.]HAS60341.1 mechanosensitive ion channel protein [Algoriphagus sp.]HCD88697.1 mechanosensitive ion channel protein [Algoriphagus sp.]HCH45539.1 mechanosensitive ion channel protein [Algoriphagus sp.]|tara:strand:+ start:2700 stop:3530 length:831 start_codon:yes stop_codon:yes gene_type:complete
MEITPETLSKITEQGIELAYTIVPKIIYAIIFYVVGRFIVNKLVKGFKRVLEKRDDNPSLNNFLVGVVKVILNVTLFIGVATTIGVEFASFVAILGAAGLAIGLALQGSLSNFAGGVLILLFKPFKVNDVIVAQGHTGVVRKIDILYTHMTTFDNKEIIIPNGSLANNDIVNMNTQENRRADLTVGVAYGTDIKKARQIILDVFDKDERALKDPAPAVYLTNFGDSSLDLSVRVWAKTSDVWPLYWDGMEAINDAFEKNDIEIPFPQRVVHKAEIS